MATRRCPRFRLAGSLVLGLGLGLGLSAARAAAAASIAAEPTAAATGCSAEGAAATTAGTKGCRGQPVEKQDDVGLLQTGSASKLAPSSDRLAKPKHWGCVAPAIRPEGPPGRPQPSPGCSAVPTRLGKMQMRDIQVPEPSLGGNTMRKYVLVLPEILNHSSHDGSGKPLPVFFFNHGQEGHALNEAKWFMRLSYGDCAEKNHFILVFPQGHRDPLKKVKRFGNIKTSNTDPDLGTGWNVGSGGDETTCVKESDTTTEGLTLYGALPTNYSCYESCVKLKQCGRCNWSTCHDDVAFYKEMLSKLAQEYCLDLSRLFVGGQSNGGMFTNRLSQELPGTFAGFVPDYGLPLLGYAAGPKGELLRHRHSLRESAFFTFHGRQDTTIPVKGGLTWSWYYSSLKELLTIWAVGIHECDATPVELSKLVDEIPHNDKQNFRCYENPNCTSGRRVVHCLIDGDHGSEPDKGAGGNMAFWLINQFRRKSTVSWDPWK